MLKVKTGTTATVNHEAIGKFVMLSKMIKNTDFRKIFDEIEMIAAKRVSKSALEFNFRRY